MYKSALCYPFNISTLHYISHPNFSKNFQIHFHCCMRRSFTSFISPPPSVFSFSFLLLLASASIVGMLQQHGHIHTLQIIRIHQDRPYTTAFKTRPTVHGRSTNRQDCYRDEHVQSFSLWHSRHNWTEIVGSWLHGLEAELDRIVSSSGSASESDQIVSSSLVPQLTIVTMEERCLFCHLLPLGHTCAPGKSGLWPQV